MDPTALDLGQDSQDPRAEPSCGPRGGLAPWRWAALVGLAAAGACGGTSAGGSADAGGCPSATGLAATIAIDPATALNTFQPILMFGVNTGFFISQQDSQNTQAKVQAAGGYLLRYPGGSSSDDYHWNGTGSYDGAQRWVPSDTTFSPGFAGTQLHRGTTSNPYGTAALVTDGDPTTAWLSNVDTDFPNEQWVYLDFGIQQTVDALQIVWGDPYATSFRVQAWNPGSSYLPPYQNAGGSWVDSSAGTVAGSGGAPTIAFDALTSQYVRILMTASSAGAGGAYSIAEVYAYDGGNQVSVNLPSAAQSSTTASTTDPASGPPDGSQGPVNFDFEQLMTYARSFTPAAVPILTVNVGTGTPQEAAAWVHYANVVKGYGIKYWEVGNELDGNWETGGPITAQDYVRRYADYYAAMKAEDPGIVVSGAVTATSDPSNLGDGHAFMQDFISILHARGQDDTVNAVSLHWYPTYDQAPPVDLAVGTTSQMAAFATSFSSWLSGTAIPANVPVLMSEYNLALFSPGLPLIDNQLAAGIWVAGWLGEFIHYFGENGGASLWNIMSASGGAEEGGKETADTTDPTVGDLGYLQHADNAYQYQAHATYWALQMMSQDWAISADSRPHTLVGATSSAASVAVYADRRPDGILALLVVNRDQTESYRAQLSTGTFSAAGTARAWIFSADNYGWETETAPYHAEPDVAPAAVTLAADASGAYTIALPPFSITVVQLTPRGQPDLAPPPPAAGCPASP
jgi:hypothetical protein